MRYRRFVPYIRLELCIVSVSDDAMFNIDWFLTSSQQYFSYIRDKNMINWLIVFNAKLSSISAILYKFSIDK
jgi:hypothetical protein